MVPTEIEERYFEDPTGAFAFRLREQLVNELLPSIRISETLIGKFGGSSVHPLSCNYLVHTAMLRVDALMRTTAAGIPQSRCRHLLGSKKCTPTATTASRRSSTSPTSVATPGHGPAWSSDGRRVVRKPPPPVPFMFAACASLLMTRHPEETDLIEAARCYAHCQISVRCSPRASTRGSRSTWCAHGRSRCHQSTERRRLLQKCWLTRNVILRVRVGDGKHPRGDGCQPEHFPAAIATQSSVLVRIESCSQCHVNNSGRMQAITARQELLDSESGKGQVSRGPLRDPRTIVH